METIRVNLKLPADLHQKVKELSVKKRTTIQDLLEDLCRLAVRAAKKGKK